MYPGPAKYMGLRDVMGEFCKTYDKVFVVPVILSAAYRFLHCCCDSHYKYETVV